MRTLMAVSVLFSIAGCVQLPTPEAPFTVGDEEQLQGTWKRVSIRDDTGSFSDVGNGWLIIAEHGFNFRDANETIWPGEYKTDTNKSPCEIDVVTTVFEKRPHKMLGIYRIEGDTLTLRFDLWGQDPLLGGDDLRPKDFAGNWNLFSKSYGRFYTFVYQRETSSVPRPTLSVSTSRPPQSPAPSP
jgi:uncharacterized protein (TIGR03067 family)